ncbi:hypothetical protein ACFYKX_25685 [Cytobacillus sp. FJAT-54145]|uniref:Uncharacterized protein n=1 Tax=Cytobacillus spartinae TaxID=3299023 RepID=A0ABW6KIE9_9BACI
MGVIQCVGTYPFPQGEIRVLWEIGEIIEHGLEIEIDLDRPCGYLEGLGNWSFGLDKDTWERWGSWIETRVYECQGNEQRLEELLAFLDSLDCTFRPEKGIHLKDLKKIKSLIERDTDELLRFKCYDPTCQHIFLSQTNLWEEYEIQCPKCGCSEEGKNNRNTHFHLLKASWLKI